MDEGFEDAIQFLNEPEAYWIKLRKTNNLERINGEIRRREHVIRIFPNNQSAFPFIGAVLMDIEETLRSRVAKSICKNTLSTRSENFFRKKGHPFFLKIQSLPRISENIVISILHKILDLTGWTPFLSMRAFLLDSFYWLDAFFVHESRSIGQFFLVVCLFCP